MKKPYKVLFLGGVGGNFLGGNFPGEFISGGHFSRGAFFLAPSSIILGEDVKVNETIPHDLKMRHELYARNPKTVR